MILMTFVVVIATAKLNQTLEITRHITSYVHRIMWYQLQTTKTYYIAFLLLLSSPLIKFMFSAHPLVNSYCYELRRYLNSLFTKL